MSKYGNPGQQAAVHGMHLLKAQMDKMRARGVSAALHALRTNYGQNANPVKLPQSGQGLLSDLTRTLKSPKLRNSLDELEKTLANVHFPVGQLTELPTGGAVLHLYANWIDKKRTQRVVLPADVMFKGRNEKYVVLLGSASRFTIFSGKYGYLDEFGDVLDTERLFVFKPTLQFESGKAFTVLQTTDQDEDGFHFLKVFASVGTYNGNIFFIGDNGLGTFILDSLQDTMFARPNFAQSSVGLAWSGYGKRSKQSGHAGQFTAKVTVDTSFSGEKVEQDFFVPLPTRLGADRNVGERIPVGLKCYSLDDRGDPIGAFDFREYKQVSIIKNDDALYLVARPNSRDQNGQLIFTWETKMAVPVVGIPDEQWVLEPNWTDQRGKRWFVAYPNEQDRVLGYPLIRLKLQLKT